MIEDSSLVVAVDADLDHETEPTQQVVVRVTDSAGNTVTKAIDIAVGDESDVSHTVSFSGGSIAESAPAGTLVAVAASNDVDDGDSITYSLADDAGGLFAIDSSTGEITTTAELDHESADGHVLRVVATDADGLAVEADLAVTVEDVNEGISGIAFTGPSGDPLAESAPGSYGFEDLAPGQTPTTLSFGNGITAEIEQDGVQISEIIERDDGFGAVAAEGANFWKVLGGETTLRFDQPLSELTFSYSDVEGGEVTVTVNGRTIALETDNSGRNDTMTLTAEPGEPIESVTFAWGTTAIDGVGFDAFTATPAATGNTAIAENAAPGTVIANVSPTDPDAGETFAYRLVDDADGRFEIDDSGTVRVGDGAAFDFESEPIVTLTVEVEDSAGHLQTAWLTVDVSDVNETPTGLTVAGGSVSEIAVPGTVVATVTAVDVDANDTHTFALVDDAEGRFEINSATGEIVVAAGAELDHETASSHTVRVLATDAAGESVEQDVTIDVGDVDESPVIATAAPMRVVEGSEFTLSVEAWKPEPIDLAGAPLESHGGSAQDIDLEATVEGGVLTMNGNGWKSLPFDYEVTEDTVLQFQFRSTGEGEIHAIGLDNDTNLNANQMFRVLGTQNWGVGDFAGEASGDGEWVTYRIPVGEYFTGSMDRLVFADDHDVASPTANSQFRNVEVFEDGERADAADGLTYNWRQVGGPDVQMTESGSAQPTVTAPDVGEDTTLTFEVTVSDGVSETVETVEVTVAANAAPIAEAGTDIEVNEGEPVQLSAASLAPAAGQIDLEAASFDDFGGSGQNTGLDLTVDNGELTMTGNGWRSIDFPITVTGDTILEVEFRSTAEGEIHGIGFDNDNGVTSGTMFKFYGTQNWGVDVDTPYEGNEGEWVTYRIPVGESFTGDFDRLVFMNDHDVADADANSQFRNLRVYTEGEELAALDSDISYEWTQTGGPSVVVSDPTAQNPTFESPAVDEPTELTFDVRVSDGDSVSTDSVTVTVNPVNDAPDTLVFTGGSVSENAAVGTVVA
ncbi:MAG: cadherin domain-containing protein, partial [Planctomycetota bacterium]